MHSNATSNIYNKIIDILNVGNTNFQVSGVHTVSDIVKFLWLEANF